MTPRKEKALQALITSRTRAEAAQAAGIGISTLRGYMHDEDFKQAYRAALDDMLSDAVRQARTGITGALSALTDIAEDAQAPPGARVSAAVKLVELGLKLTEIGDISQRMTALEKDRGDDPFDIF